MGDKAGEGRDNVYILSILISGGGDYVDGLK